MNVKKKIIYFIIPLLIIAFPLDFLISHFIKKSNWFAEGEFPVWNAIYNNQVNSEILIYGSSKAWSGFDPMFFQDSFGVNCYNLGIDGHNFRLEYLRHLEYLKHNPKPKVIIMEVDVLTLHTREDLYNYAQFFPYIYNKNVRTYTSSYVGFKTIDYYIPLARYMGEYEAVGVMFKNILRLDNKTTERIRGFKANDYDWRGDLDKAREEIGELYVDIDEQSVDLFNQFLAYCQNNDIGVVLVFPPDYIEGQDFVANRDELVTIFKDFSHKYNIPFFDYSSNAICLSKDYFYNSSHLNKRGVIFFNEILVSDLKKCDYFMECINK